MNDYDSWKQIITSGNEIRKEKGSKGLTIYRSAKDPNTVYGIVEWDDQKSYLDYFNLPEVQKGLADSGTTEIIEISESFSLEA